MRLVCVRGVKELLQNKSRTFEQQPVSLTTSLSSVGMLHLLCLFKVTGLKLGVTNNPAAQ